MDPVEAVVTGQAGINWTQIIVTAIVTGFPLLAAWINLRRQLTVIKTDVNSNTLAAATREAALRERIKALDSSIADLREERARGTTTTPATTVPAGAAMVDPDTPLVVLDPTVGPDPNAKGK